MKKLLFILLSVLLYSCSNEMLFDTDMTDTSTTTRTAVSDSTYYFEGYFSPELQDIVSLPFKTDSIRQTIVSYKETNLGVTDITPEVLSKPSWVNKVIFYHAYYKIFEVFICVDANTSPEKREGRLVLKQPESNKTISIGITQQGIDNYIRIQVNKTYNNHYEFIATTDYPVKGDVWVRIPVVVYNDGGELAQEIGIDIAKGERTGFSEADWNSSPLVYYHGDIKEYRLSEGRFGGKDDVYTYSFIRYW